jgi:hypothetical protein
VSQIDDDVTGRPADVGGPSDEQPFAFQALQGRQVEDLPEQFVADRAGDGEHFDGFSLGRPERRQTGLHDVFEQGGGGQPPRETEDSAVLAQHPGPLGAQDELPGEHRVALGGVQQQPAGVAGQRCPERGFDESGQLGVVQRAEVDVFDDRVVADPSDRGGWRASGPTSRQQAHLTGGEHLVQHRRARLVEQMQVVHDEQRHRARRRAAHRGRDE